MFILTQTQVLNICPISTNRTVQIEFHCDHNVTHQNELQTKSFLSGKIQRTGTIKGHDVLPPSRKDKSQHVFNVPANVSNLPKNADGTIVSNTNGHKPCQINQTYTKCTKQKHERCHIQFTLFCGKQTQN